MKTIGYVGPFGDSNFGDYAMLVNNIYDIDNKDIVIFTYNKSLVESVSDYYLKDYNTEIVEVISREIPLITTGKSFKIEYDNYVNIPMEVIDKILNYDEIVTKIRKIDILVVNGGGFLNHFWNAKHRQFKLFSIMAVILAAEQLNKKIVFLGNTYGPFGESAEFYKYFFGRLNNAIYASRDNLCSPLNMREIGINQEVTVLPDDLYFINHRLLPDNIYGNFNGNYIILELYESIDYLERKISLINNFAKTVKSKYGLDVIFLPLDNGYGGQYQGEYLKKYNCNIELYKFNNGFLPIEDAEILIKNAKLIVCHRYHLFVRAIANNIPVIHILKNVYGDKRYYYNKGIGMLNNILSNQEWSEFLFFSLDIESVFDKILNSLYDIVNSQKELFNIKKTDKEKILSQTRNEYIKNNIL